jgi:hypothetical protein
MAQKKTIYLAEVINQELFSSIGGGYVLVDREEIVRRKTRNKVGEQVRKFFDDQLIKKGLLAALRGKSPHSIVYPLYDKDADSAYDYIMNDVVPELCGKCEVEVSILTIQDEYEEGQYSRPYSDIVVK